MTTNSAVIYSDWSVFVRYLALGDSISIDDYTGVPGGGAASQFAGLIQADQFVNHTRDGATCDDVLGILGGITDRPDVVTLTAGGNDFLLGCWSEGRLAHVTGDDSVACVSARPLATLAQIADRLASFCCPVIMNTIYDPSNGDDSIASEVGIDMRFRSEYNALNAGIKDIARAEGFLLADLEELFQNHGIVSPDTWITGYIEPNYAGATAIARLWHSLYSQRLVGKTNFS